MPRSNGRWSTVGNIVLMQLLFVISHGKMEDKCRSNLYVHRLKNNSSSTAVAVRVAENLQGTFNAREICYSKYRKCLNLTAKVKVTEYIIYNGEILWRISTSLEVIWRSFAIALTVSEILIFQICDHDNLGYDHRVHHSQWSLLMANITHRNGRIY